MRLIYCCLLATALLSYLADAQNPYDPQRPYYPPHKEPQQPQTPYRPPVRPQNPYIPPLKEPQQPQTPYRPPVQPQSPYIPPPKEPQQPPAPSPPPPPPPPPTPFHSCEVDQYAKIQCGAPTITASECEAINCCFDGHMCYYGKFVTLQCTKDGQFIIVVARDATLPNIDLESINLLGAGPNCSPVGTTSAFAIYQFPVTACGTVMKEEPGVIIYENRMSSFYEVAMGPLGAITRDTHYELLVQCRYIGTSVQALVVEVGLVPPPPPVAAPGPLRVELRLGNGQCTIKGCVEEDVAYTSYYTDADYPVAKVLRDPVYVEIRMLDRTDPNLVLNLGRCWATTSEFPQSVPQWDLLIDGCPNHNDHYLTHLVPVDPSSGVMYPTHYKRFIFKMFTFVGISGSDATKKAPDAPGFNSLREKVYIHCDVSVCQTTPTHTCDPVCYRHKRSISSSARKLQREETTLVSSKEVIMTGMVAQ